MIQVRVVASACDQLVMGTLFGYFSVFDDVDAVSILHRGDAVRDQNRGPAAHHARQAGKDALQPLRCMVQAINIGVTAPPNPIPRLVKLIPSPSLLLPIQEPTIFAELAE